MPDFTAAFCWNPITWIMDNIFAPLLDILIAAMLPILQWGVEFLGEILLTALSDIFFDIFVILLKIVSFFTNAFFSFAGVYNIALRTNGKFEQSDTFVLQYLMDNMGLTRIYWMMTLVSAALCIVFTGISVLRSMNNTEFDPKQTVGKVWGRLGKTLLTFLVIPAVMLFSIELSTRITGALVESGPAPTSVDNMIFLSTTMNAAHNNTYNGNNASFTDALRKKYFDGSVSYETHREGAKSYDKSDRLCADDFDLTKIDYLTGYIVSVVMIFIMLGAALMAVGRLLEIMLLYVAAPMFVASIPLDDGKKFEGWRDMFVAKLVSSYGLILMMTLYLAFVPTIMGGGLSLATDGLQDSLMKVVLLLGGAFALKNSHTLLLNIINPTAAQSAQGSVLAGMALGMSAVNKVKGKVSSLGRGRGGGGHGGGGGNSSASSQNSPGAQVQHKSAEEAQKYG